MKPQVISSIKHIRKVMEEKNILTIKDLTYAKLRGEGECLLSKLQATLLIQRTQHVTLSSVER
jgi:hypothetical protein